MKVDKYSILLVHNFQIFNPITLPEFASITQFFLKFDHFLHFLHIFSLIWLHWALSWVLERIRISGYDFRKKCYICCDAHKLYLAPFSPQISSHINFFP